MDASKDLRDRVDSIPGAPFHWVTSIEVHTGREGAWEAYQAIRPGHRPFSFCKILLISNSF